MESKTKEIKCCRCQNIFQAYVSSGVGPSYCPKCRPNIKETYRAGLLVRPTGDPVRCTKVSNEKWASVFLDLVEA